MRISDWSSDVCSSDLVIGTAGAPGAPGVEGAEGVVIQVSDTGVGIAAAHLDKVMSPFGQVHAALHRETQGTGLGLPLSKALVDLHGGRLPLENTPGQGPIARIELPGRAAPRALPGAAVEPPTGAPDTPK